MGAKCRFRLKAAASDPFCRPGVGVCRRDAGRGEGPGWYSRPAPALLPLFCPISQPTGPLRVPQAASATALAALVSLAHALGLLSAPGGGGSIGGGGSTGGNQTAPVLPTWTGSTGPYSSLWGASGEAWSPSGRLNDYSFAGRPGASVLGSATGGAAQSRRRPLFSPATPARSPSIMSPCCSTSTLCLETQHRLSCLPPSPHGPKCACCRPPA